MVLSKISQFVRGWHIKYNFLNAPCTTRPGHALVDNCFDGILCSSQTLLGETAMAKDKDKGKEKGNKPKLSVKEKKLKKKEKLNKKTSMV
jgi:hypothetical protein